MDNFDIAGYYRLLGNGFEVSAKILEADLELKKGGRPANYKCLPYYVLANQAMELYLKAALLKRNFTVEQLKSRPYGHNLSYLLVKLKEQNVSISESTTIFINNISQQHLDRRLSYDVFYRQGKSFLPPPSWVNQVLEELVSCISLRLDQG